MYKTHIAMIGTGYVGLVSGTCFADMGHQVICVDKDKEKLERLKCADIPIYEAGLTDKVRRNLEEKRLVFSNNSREALQKSDVIFIAVGTPPCVKTGQADLRYITKVAEEIAPFMDTYKVIVIKSTVPIGTGRWVKNIIRKINPNANFDMVSNPEFLREGSAVDDFLYPDRIVIGTGSEKAKKIMESIYKPFIVQGIPLIYTDVESAELIKYAANGYLATKIAFMNEMANLCEKTGADINKVAAGLSLDKRIGAGHLKVGPGFGGSCFPKDTKALVHVAQELGVSLSIIESVIQSNDARKIQMIDKIVAACSGSVQRKRIAILGVAFKANTDDIRDSSALVIIRGLQALGADIVAYDPAAMRAAKSELPGIVWAKDAYYAMQDAEITVILTEWQAFSNLDFSCMKKNPIVVDLRNLYDPKTMAEKGIQYISIGRACPLSNHTQKNNTEYPSKVVPAIDTERVDA